MDFAALPVSTSLRIYKLGQLEGAGTAAGATSLRCLALGSVYWLAGYPDY